MTLSPVTEAVSVTRITHCGGCWLRVALHRPEMMKMMMMIISTFTVTFKSAGAVLGSCKQGLS